MFETFFPLDHDGHGLLSGFDEDSAPVIVQRISQSPDGLRVVNLIPTNGDLPHQAVIVPLFNAIESL
jgi:hypothetical protein